jgi:thiol-disulfide isomerase/thioredoxin
VSSKRSHLPCLVLLGVLAQLLPCASPIGWASEPAGEFTDSSGQARSLDELRGQVAVVNFWATWCAPCVAELPMLGAAHREYSERGVRFVAVSADEPGTRERIPDAVAKAGIGFPVWIGATTGDMERLGLGSALPATAIVDRKGEIVFRIRGPLTQAQLIERLDWLLGDRAEAAPAAAIDTFGADAAADAHGDEHDHCEEEAAHHDHGTDHGEGASQVPS